MYLGRIATKGTDVFLHPRYGCKLVLKPKVHRTKLVRLRSLREPEGAKVEADVDDWHSLNRAISQSRGGIAQGGRTHRQNTLHYDFTSVEDVRDALEEALSVYPQHDEHKTLGPEHQLGRAEDVTVRQPSETPST